MTTRDRDNARRIYRLIEELYPICRSITGDGVRTTLNRLQQLIPLEIHEVPSGTEVLDWTVPPEWNIRDAWIKDKAGRKLVDFHQSNLHVVSYSVPFRGRIGRDELQKHLYTLPEHPDWIPYRTSYYNRSWGFCIPHRLFMEMNDAEYDVCIDSRLEQGNLSYGDLQLPGDLDETFLISAHVCHPSLCNDNLSGVSIAAHLAAELMRRDQRRFTYRFLFIPGTIGAITWLARNLPHLDTIRGGMTLVCLGDDHPLTFKRSLAGDSIIDRTAEHVLRHLGEATDVIDYHPYGYDERQFNSPGFRLPVGSLMRGRHGQFPEYHTSADDLAFVRPELLGRSFAAIQDIVDVIEGDRCVVNQCPYGEPQLGRRGIYKEMDDTNSDIQKAILWVLSLSDGVHSLLDIADQSRYPFSHIQTAADLLERHGIIREATSGIRK